MMRPFVSSFVALALTCLACGSPGSALGEQPGSLDPSMPTQTVVAGDNLDPPAGHSASPTVQAPAPPMAKSANPLWDVPIDTLSATRDRPIFSASRRPPPAAAAVTVMRAPPPPPKEPERPALQLVGTVIGDDESFGIFVDSSSQTPLRLRVGASHEGWRLHSLKPREATLQKNLETVNVTMPQLGPTAGGEVGAVPTVAGGRERVARRSR